MSPDIPRRRGMCTTGNDVAETRITCYDDTTAWLAACLPDLLLRSLPSSRPPPLSMVRWVENDDDDDGDDDDDDERDRPS